MPSRPPAPPTWISRVGTYPHTQSSALPAWTSACRTARWATPRSATLNIGAGRIVYQELTRITKSIQDGDFFKNPKLCWTPWTTAKKNGGKLHLMGLLSDGGVHSHNTHLYAPDRTGQAAGSGQGVRPLLHGRPRRAALLRQRVRRSSCRTKWTRSAFGKIATIIGPLLRHGPRQPLGPRGEGL